MFGGVNGGTRISGATFGVGGVDSGTKIATVRASHSSYNPA